MKLLQTLSSADRCIIAAVVLFSVLAVAFPVKETCSWDGTQWSKWDTQVVAESETSPRFSIVPFPEVGPVGRRFITDRHWKLEEMNGGSKWLWFKEQPDTVRLGFDVFFIMLAGLCAKFIRAGRSRIQETAQVGD